MIGAGVSGSRGERPDTMNVQRVAAAVSRKIKIYLLRVGHGRDGGERNDRNGEIKDRETPRGQKNGGRARWSREAARARSQQDALEGGSRHGGTDPESFTYGKKESRLEICVFGSVIWSASRKCRACTLRSRHESCTFSTFSSLDSPTCPLRTFQEGVHSPYKGARGLVVWG